MSKQDKKRDTGVTPKAAEYLAASLVRLMELPLGDEAEVKNWYAECGKVQRTLIEDFPKFEFDHEVWHFFADADIRARDEKYRAQQHQLMSEYVNHLQQYV